MTRTTKPRTKRRRKAAERTNGAAQRPAAPNTKQDLSQRANPSPLGAIMQNGITEPIGLHFEIASEDEMKVADQPSHDPAARATTPGDGVKSDPSIPGTTGGNGKAAAGARSSKRSASDEPSAQDLLYNAAREAHAQGETGRAMAIYRELLAMNPGHVRARNNFGLLLDRMGDHDEALLQLQLCLNTEPDNPSVLVNRGGVLGSLGRFAEAEDDLRRALDHDTTNAEAHFNLGLLMSRRGLWADALPFLRRSIELDLGRATAYLYLGDALNHVDDLDGALQAYQRSVELVPNNAKAFYGLGIIYDRMNRPEDAQQMYRRSRELAGR